MSTASGAGWEAAILPTGNKPPRPIRPSAIDRHQLARVRARTRIKQKNSLVLPGIDIAQDIDLINQGFGQHVGDSRDQINGRVYVVKPDGAAYPGSGEGVVSVGPFVMSLLRDMIAHVDDPEALEFLIQRNRRYTDDVVEEASLLFAIWKRVP